MRRVAIIYDSPSWAFHRIARQVAIHKTSDIEITLIPSGHPQSWRTFHSHIAGEFDWYHYLWRGGIESIASSGVTNISTAVYDQQFLDEPKFAKRLLHGIPFYVSSAKLLWEYSALFPNRIIPVCSDGVDQNFFYPRSAVGSRSILRVGWVGNSTWGHNSNKGFSEIFLKSINEAKRIGLPVEAHVADASVVKRTLTQMADFYQEIDVLACTSMTEGTPNPILEASASGRGWISTDVGIVPELTGPLQREFIVERSVESFVSVYKRLVQDWSLAQRLGGENRSVIENRWCWDFRATAIVKFLNDAMDSHSTHHG